MLKKCLLTLSLLVPLALSTAAQAGSTITDKSYWPSEARQTTSITQGEPNSAFAYDRSGQLQPTPYPTAVESPWRYHGGPKSR